MRIVTWNVNGLRAAIRKGIDNWFADVDAEIWMLQETRVLEEQLPKGWEWPATHQVILHPAEKKGYSGVATLSTVDRRHERHLQPPAHHQAQPPSFIRFLVGVVGVVHLLDAVVEHNIDELVEALQYAADLAAALEGDPYFFVDALF